MERVFADTGYWIALLNPRDDLQNKATAVARDYRSGPDRNERDGSHRVPQQLQRLRAATAASGSKGGRIASGCIRDRYHPADNSAL